MKRDWIAVLCIAAVLGSSVPARALSIADVFHHRGKPSQTQARTCIRQKAWVAYLRSDKGRLSPVRDTQDTSSDKDWLGLRFTDYDGPRIRLGVLKVINKSPESEETGRTEKIQVPVAGIQEMLTVALYNTKRFDVIEQKRIDEVKGQQTRKDMIEPSPASIQNFGRVLQAQYLVYGTINEWSPERSNRSLSPMSMVGGKKEAEVSITFFLTDVATGQTLFTTGEQARLSEWNFGFGGLPSKLPGGLGGTNGAMTERTPVTYAVRACVNKAAFKIATFLRNRKWKGTVVDIKKADVYINAGLQQGMAPKTKLSVQAVRGQVRDPESHMTLGEDLRGVGTLEVIAVQNAFSIARVVESSEKVKPGYRVELASNPVLPQTIPGCDDGDPTTD